MLRSALALLFFVGSSVVQAGGSHDAARWQAPANQSRLRIAWETYGKGDEQPRPPMLLFVTDDDNVDALFADVRVIFAMQGVRAVHVETDAALDLPWLGSLVIRDPMVVVVDGNAQVVGALATRKQLKPDRCLELFAKLAGRAHLSTYVKSRLRVLHRTESLWKRHDTADTETWKQDAELLKQDRALSLAWTERLNTAGAVKPGPVAETPRERESARVHVRSANTESPLGRAAAIESLGAVDTGRIAREVLKHAPDGNFWVRHAVGRTLGGMRSGAARRATKRALFGTDDAQIAAALLAYERILDPTVTGRIITLLESPSEEVRYAALRALIKYKSEASMAALGHLLTRDEPALRVLAATALGKIGHPHAVADLVTQLRDKDWSVRRAAIQALRAIRHRDCIPPLLKQLGKEEGSLVDLVRTALVELTAIDWGAHPAKWNAWWRKNSAGFALPTRAEAADALSCSTAPLADGERDCATIRTRSKSLAFVIDLTPAMDGKALLPAGLPEGFRKKYAGRDKLEIVRREVTACVESLDATDRFNIVVFSDRVRRFRPAPVPARARARAEAVRFLRNLPLVKRRPRGSGRTIRSPAQPGGSTSSARRNPQPSDLYGALKAALGLAPGWKQRCDTDTVFLFPAQLPGEGDVQDAGRLIRLVSELNRTRGVVIHLAACNILPGMRLAPLAWQNGGSYVLISR